MDMYLHGSLFSVREGVLSEFVCHDTFSGFCTFGHNLRTIDLGGGGG